MKRNGLLVRALSGFMILCMAVSLAACGAPPNKGNKNEVNVGFPAGGDNILFEDAVPGGVASERGDEIENGGEYGDEYTVIKENAFVSTSAEDTSVNISTFSADVDTASYAYFRKIAGLGQYPMSALPGFIAKSVRTEEWVNYFDYDYAEATDSVFGVKTDIVTCPWNDENLLMRISLKATGKTESVGNNLVFLIDVSGSMASNDKLGLIKESFGYLIDRLGENDRVSIVTYSGREAVVLEGCSGDRRAEIMAAVNSLSAGGSTNGEAGIKKAYQIAEANRIEGGNNRIIMASDGDLNVGISSADELKEFITEKKESGIYISVLGFGTGNYKDNRMEAIADNGNGVYYYIDGAREGERIFGDKLTETLYTVAEDVKLQVTFDPEFVSSYRLIGYENRVLSTEDFNDDSKDAGDVGAGATVTALYELKMSNGYESAEGSYATLAIRYKDPGEANSILKEYGIGKGSLTEADDEMQFISAVVMASMLVRDSEYKGDITLDTVLEMLSSITLDDEYKEEFRDMLVLIKNKDGSAK